MARRTEPRSPKLAFDHSESGAITSALDILFKRTTYHLVASKFELPSLVDTYRSLVDQSVWAKLEAAQELMQLANYSPTYVVDVEISNIAKLEIKSEQLLPKYINCLTPIPEFVTFSHAADQCRQQWNQIKTLFNKLNNQASRNAIAFYWPCVGALLKLGGKEDDTLASIVRPGTLAASLTVALRDTNAFVMQHMMLPKIDSGNSSGYEGTEKTLAARLMFTGGVSFWPLGE